MCIMCYRIKSVFCSCSLWRRGSTCAYDRITLNELTWPWFSRVLLSYNFRPESCPGFNILNPTSLSPHGANIRQRKKYVRLCYRNYQPLLHMRHTELHVLSPDGSTFMREWRHGRQLESLTSYPKSDSVSRCALITWSTILCRISRRARSDLKRRSLVLFWRSRAIKNNKMSSDMRSVPDPIIFGTTLFKVLNKLVVYYVTVISLSLAHSTI